MSCKQRLPVFSAVVLAAVLATWRPAEAQSTRYQLVEGSSLILDDTADPIPLIGSMTLVLDDVGASFDRYSVERVELRATEADLRLSGSGTYTLRILSEQTQSLALLLAIISGDTEVVDFSSGQVPVDSFELGPIDLWLTVPGSALAVPRLRIVAEPRSAPRFLRGDADASGSVDVTDAVRLLEHLFLGGEETACADAADSNDSGALDVSDAVVVLLHLFGGTPRIAPPGPETCGEDPTDDRLGCERSSCP